VRLRVRLALTTVAVVVPVAVGLIWLNAELRNRAGEENLASFTLEHMQSGGRAHCEADPASWGGATRQVALDAGEAPRAHDGPAAAAPLRWGARWGPPPILFAYDAALRPLNPRAPPVEQSLAAAMSGARDFAARRFATPTGSFVEVLVRTPWRQGACAFVLARGPGAPSGRLAPLPALRLWMVPLGLVFGAVLLAVGPIVRRIRRLTEAVRRSAIGGYTGAIAIGGADEIAELAGAFDEAARQIRTQLAHKERREQALRQFLANTTHDMMIPLTVLQGHLAALEERAARGDPVNARVIASAMDEAHYMASLMHNLAIAAKLDSDEPQVHLGTVDLNALVGRVVGRHAPIARQLAVELESAVPEDALITRGDVTLLEQAVSNVVYNAIHHNRTHGHAAVILERLEGRRFRLRVVDDGPGIPSDELSRLLERGFRGAEARTRARDGQGIGLDITYRIAQLHRLTLELGPSRYGGLQVDLAGELTG